MRHIKFRQQGEYDKRHCHICEEVLPKDTTRMTIYVNEGYHTEYNLGICKECGATLLNKIQEWLK